MVQFYSNAVVNMFCTSTRGRHWYIDSQYPIHMGKVEFESLLVSLSLYTKVHNFMSHSVSRANVCLEDRRNAHRMRYGGTGMVLLHAGQP